MAAKTAGTDAVGTGEVTLFDATVCGYSCRKWACATDAAVQIHADGLHTAGEFFPMAANDSITLRGSITKVTAKTASGTANVNHGVVGR